MMIRKKKHSSSIEMFVDRGHKLSQNILFIHIHDNMFCDNKIILFGNFEFIKFTFIIGYARVNFKVIRIKVSY